MDAGFADMVRFSWSGGVLPFGVASTQPHKQRRTPSANGATVHQTAIAMKDQTLIDAALERAKCTQKELAQRAGIAPSRLSDYRTGVRSLTFEAGVKIAAAAGLDAEAWAAARAREIVGNAKRLRQKGTAATGLLAVIAAAAGAGLAGGLREIALMFATVNTRRLAAS